MTKPSVITLDFFGTVVDHRNGIGRGRKFGTYLESKGLKANPWDRGILYGLFDYYAEAYTPNLSDQEKRYFWIEFTRLLFEKAKINSTPDDRRGHAEAIRDIFGSSSFELFPDVKDLLSNLRTRGFRLGLISNWTRGLNHFCEELEIAPYFDVIISSADAGYEKPDARIFNDALSRLGASADQTLHVGDSIVEDFNGATEAGLSAILIDRRNVHAQVSDRKVRDLYELNRLVA